MTVMAPNNDKIFLTFIIDQVLVEIPSPVERAFRTKATLHPEKVFEQRQTLLALTDQRARRKRTGL